MVEVRDPVPAEEVVSCELVRGPQMPENRSVAVGSASSWPGQVTGTGLARNRAGAGPPTLHFWA